MNLRLRILALFVSAVACASAADAPPNIVLIISDDHHWGGLRIHGASAHPDARISTSWRRRACSSRAAMCPAASAVPSLAAIITGQYPAPELHHQQRPAAAAGGKGKRAKREGSAAFQKGREVFNQHMDQLATLPRLLGEAGLRQLPDRKVVAGRFHPRRLHPRHDERRTPRG